jgi:5'-deoxynucleotidase YfbR-like HD superfamily hydrolase
MDQRSDEYEILAYAERAYELTQVSLAVQTHWGELTDKDRAWWRMQVASQADMGALKREVETLENDTQIFLYRQAGNVERCHTVLHHGSYSIANHSWQAVMLLFALYPGTPSQNLVLAVLGHDLAEQPLGDIPSPAKHKYPELAKLFGEIEARVMTTHFPVVSRALTALTPEENAWLKGVDRLELWMWAVEQHASGNTHVSHLRERVEHYMTKDPAPEEIMAYMKRCLSRARGDES